jgi:hypothetical protein
LGRRETHCIAARFSYPCVHRQRGRHEDATAILLAFKL